jgi:hypothetical protein
VETRPERGGARYSSLVPASASIPPPLITTEDVRHEIHRLFDAGADSGLVIRVYGDDGDSEAADATFREMLASLQMYGAGAEVVVQAPNKTTLARAMAVIGREEHQKRILNHVLTTFGRRLIDPLGGILDTTPEGSLVSRLSMTRTLFLAQLAELRLTPESQQILCDDLRKLLSDDYLAMVAENEERVQRPRVTRVAQEVLRLIGSTFRRAFARWPAHAEQIAASIARRAQGDVKLRDLPVLLREQITAGIEEFLWVETSNDIEGALHALFAEHKSAVPVEPPSIERDTYREFAGACWQIIADHC